MLSRVLKIAQKEFFSFFSSPIAYIFLGTFVVVSLYNFFWVDKFFARNIADLRPLFHSLPLLLLFLVSAITMKMWSEEKKMGTLEFLLTAPVRIWELVAGKFFACLVLVACGLVLTFSLPVMVANLGELDWGPVIGAYFGSFFLAAAYIAIGLFVSSRSENQIVSLIISILTCLVFYLIGQTSLTSLFSTSFAEFLAILSTSDHFDSISRGVIEIKDLYYYLSLTAIFLILNVFALTKVKWSQQAKAKNFQFRLVVVLIIANLLIANFWVNDIRSIRADLTTGHIHTLSDSTKNLLAQVKEPLLIRAYISNTTHPLLMPLIPQIKDTLEAYQNAGNGKVNAELIDPKDNPELEEEVGRRFNVKPVPLQVSDRYQASLVSAYFDLVVQYGDKFETLNFRNLIEVNPVGDTGVDVKLKNLEYDLSRAVKKVLYGFQDVESIFANLKEKVVMKAYISSRLPKSLEAFKATTLAKLEETKVKSSDKFDYQVIDPLADGGAVAKEVLEKYGLQPMVASLFDQNQFYFYLILENSDLPINVGLPEELNSEGLQKALDAAFKRLTPGFLKTVGLVMPKPAQPANPYQQDTGKQFNFLYESLSANHNIRNIELEVPVSEEIDLLLLLAPKDLSQKSLFNLDNFLMRGGTIILSTSPYQTQASPGGIMMENVKSGMEDWLKSYGITFKEGVVLDERNEPFPAPVKRDVGGYLVEEIQLHNYPPFVDVRGEGLAKENLFLSGISQVTLNWPSALEINPDLNKDREVHEFLKSSDKSWLLQKFNPNPDYQRYPELGFEQMPELRSYPIGATVQGTFESYFKGKPLDFLKEQPAAVDPNKPDAPKPAPLDKFSALIEKSPSSARIIILGSNEFLADQTLQMSSMSGSTRYTNSITLMQNAIDTSLEDPALVEIRGRSNFARTLDPMSAGQKMFWEYFNYVFALVLLIAIGVGLKIKASRKSIWQKKFYLQSESN